MNTVTQINTVTQMNTVTQDAPALAELRDLPRSERRDTLEDLVVAEFRAALQMEPHEPFATDSSYFELGFTSLLIIEVKDRLELLLGHPVSANVLFNLPTVDRLLDHLTGEVLAGLFDPAATPNTGKEAGQ